MQTAHVLNLPGTEASLRIEIDRLRLQLQMVQLKVEELMKSHQERTERPISVYMHGRYRLVYINEIIMVNSMGNYSMIYLDGGEALMTSRTLKYWEKQCSTDSLVRVHNSFLIHRNKIIAIQPDQCTIALHGGLTAQYTRRSKRLLLGLLGHSIQTPKTKSPKLVLRSKS